MQNAELSNLSEMAPSDDETGRPTYRATKIWWVNQGDSFDEARSLGRIFAPLTDKAGKKRPDWERVAEVQPGDILVHNSAGNIRAIGRAISEPTIESRQYSFDGSSDTDGDAAGRRVDVDYFDLEPPILTKSVARQILEMGIADGPIAINLQAKQGYLYRFSAVGLRYLHDISESRWPPWAEQKVSAPPTRNSNIDSNGRGVIDSGFDSLRYAIAANGLHFSIDIVSNYLLALQTKRFVLLTGISGTGKTQLALAVANRFRTNVPVPRVAALPDGALDVVVTPSNLKYSLIVLPTWFAANLADPPTGGGEQAKKVRIVYPEGEQILTLSKAAAQNVTRIFFSGAFREWFQRTFSAGDHLALELLQRGDESMETFRIHLPTIVQETRPLQNHVVSAVRPDWTDNRGLLGYFNPLIGSYVMTPFLRFLLEARDEVERARQERREPAPFFAILDEMNLARVEHYFSDFLSALESGEPIHLHDHVGIEEGETEDAVAVPRQLRVPENVYFTGTVNVDETTYMFSPKVLDRAFTIELNRVDLEAFGAESSATSNEDDAFALSRFSGTLGPSPKPSAADWAAFGALLDGQLRQVVIDLHHLLSEEDRHFGYRVANEIARFVNLASDQTDGTGEALWIALDLAILQKVLPKFHGTQQELETALTRLMAFVEPLPLPRTEAKLRSMHRRLGRQGFTSFIE